MARDLKPELIALLGLTEEQREIILRLDPKVELEGLEQYRKGLEVWDPPQVNSQHSIERLYGVRVPVIIPALVSRFRLPRPPARA